MVVEVGVEALVVHQGQTVVMLKTAVGVVLVLTVEVLDTTAAVHYMALVVEEQEEAAPHKLEVLAAHGVRRFLEVEVLAGLLGILLGQVRLVVRMPLVAVMAAVGAEVGQREIRQSAGREEFPVEEEEVKVHLTAVALP